VMVKDVRQGWTLLATMLVLFVVGLAVTVPVERHATAALRAAGVESSADNLEGKEMRFGSDESALWAVATTAASNGSVNSMHDSFTPLGAAAPMFLMAIGEVAFGGVGSGLYGMLFYVVLAVFIGGLMVGRTPEYLGKKIGAREVKLALLAILGPILIALAAVAGASVMDFTLDARNNSGPHGFSEILYAWLSMGNNNGSAFAGLTVTNWYYAVFGGFTMIFVRFVPLLCALALAGSLARERILPETAGTLKTGTPLFAGLLTGTIVLLGALDFLPVLTLGPFVEWLFDGGGRLF
jgi:potassium-transporting ATPase potassium-binding subunit